MPTRYFFLCFLFLANMVCCSAIKAQNSTINPTKVAVHINQPFYVNGEKIWYKIYLPASFKSKDLPVKIVLTNNNAKVIADAYVNTQGQTFIEGQIKIPIDIPSDNYYLLGYGTHKTTKDFVKLMEVEIPIYNDLEENLKVNTTNPIGVKEASFLPEDLVLSIDLKEENIHKRTAINATVQVLDKNGKSVKANLSIAIRDASLNSNLLTNGQSVWATAAKEGITPAILDTLISLKGKITSLEGAVKRLPIMSAFAKAENKFHYFSTDDAGNFSLSLPDFSGQKSVQFINFEKEDIKVQLANSLTIEKNSKLLVTKELKNYLSLSRKRKKLSQLFKTSLPVIEKRGMLSRKKDLKAGFSYILEDYESFEDFYSLCKEVSSPLKISKDKEGVLSAKMFNPEQTVRRFYSGTPIFIVDGKVTKDVAFINQLDLNLVTQVDLFFDKKRLKELFGTIGSSGVVVIKTTIPTIQLPATEANSIFTINGLLMAESYPTLDVSTLNVPSHIPLFQPNLFWMANKATDAAGIANFSFFQTDDLGTFEIEIVAQDEDGNIGVGTTTYVVKK